VNRPYVFVVLVCTLAAGGCAGHTDSKSSPAPAPSPRRTPKPALAKHSPAPHAAIAAPSASPSVAVAPSRVPALPAPSPAPTAVRLPPQAAPRILGVDLSATATHPGQTVYGTVTVTSNVASVELRIGTYGVTMQKTGVGRFSLAFPVDGLPFFLRRTYTVHVIARNAAGDSDERTTQLHIP
jgi:hypothetical protein